MRKDWPDFISRYEACFKCILAIADNSSALAGLYHHASFWAGDRLSIATSRSLFKPQPMAYLYCHRRDSYCDFRRLGGNECKVRNRANRAF